MRAGRSYLYPLTARSVILSVLLGTHPPVLSARTLVGTLALFGIAEGTTRVALSRLAAEGDLVAEGGRYRLSGRLLERQKLQDEALRPPTRPWKGGWELAVAASGQTSPAQKNALGADMARLRLACLRAGVWVRPDNLNRPWPAELAKRAWRFESISPPFGPMSPAELVAELWDLGGWASFAQTLVADLGSCDDPAQRFEIATALVRHLRCDPVLPAELLPPDWPGASLRRAYDSYRKELARLIERQRRQHDP